MAFMSPAQIKEAILYRAAVDTLQKSYAAGKVITTIQKTAAEGATPATYYDVDEYLQTLKTSMESIENDQDEVVTDADIQAIFIDS